MTLRISTALSNHLLQEGSLKSALRGGKLQIYTGTQPATADAAVAGTLLATLTLAGGAHTFETRATGTVTLSGTTGGVATLTVDGVNLIPAGAVPFNTSLAQTAADLAAAINLNATTPDYTATAATGVVTIKAARNSGASPNGFVVTGTYTGDMGATYGNMASGVDSVNGLDFGVATARALGLGSYTWSGTAVAAGTAGWGRIVCDSTDSGAADTNLEWVRLDGSCGTSSAYQFMLNSTTVAIGDTLTATTFAFTIPGG